MLLPQKSNLQKWHTSRTTSTENQGLLGTSQATQQDHVEDHANDQRVRRQDLHEEKEDLLFENVTSIVE